MELGFQTQSAKWIYVGDTAGTNWYFWDKEADKAVPITSDNLRCIVLGIDVIEREFKGKTSIKVVLTVNAGDTYKIQFGINTWFAKTFIVRLAQLSAIELASPITIKTRKGEDGSKVIFGSIFDSFGKTIKKPESLSYDECDETKLLTLITEIDKKLHVKHNTEDDGLEEELTSIKDESDLDEAKKELFPF